MSPLHPLACLPACLSVFLVVSLPVCLSGQRLLLLSKAIAYQDWTCFRGEKQILESSKLLYLISNYSSPPLSHREMLHIFNVVHLVIYQKQLIKS